MNIPWLSIAIMGLGMSAVPGQGEEPTPELRAALWSAITAGDLERVKSLLDEEPKLASIRNDKDVSAPLFALYYRKGEIGELLLSRKESSMGPSSVDAFEAAAFGRVERLRALLDADRETANAFSSDGFFPLGLAAFFGREDAVELLLARGADPDSTARNPMKVRALHAAAAAQSVSIARRLLDAGAEVDARQEGGFTPLQEAAASGKLELVRLLLDRGARADSKNDAGKSAIDLAREKNQSAVLELLTSRAGRE